MKDEKNNKSNLAIQDEAEAQTTETGADQKSIRPIAYVRPVSKEELAEQLPDDAPEGPYFAVHDEEGRPLALFTDQETAFVAAKVHQYSPVHVH
ncbi:MAG: DUF1150 family protein [Pseudomonadota bacterium]